MQLQAFRNKFSVFTSNMLQVPILTNNFYTSIGIYNSVLVRFPVITALTQEHCHYLLCCSDDVLICYLYLQYHSQCLWKTWPYRPLTPVKRRPGFEHILPTQNKYCFNPSTAICFWWRKFSQLILHIATVVFQYLLFERLSRGSDHMARLKLVFVFWGVVQ